MDEAPAESIRLLIADGAFSTMVELVAIRDPILFGPNELEFTTSYILFRTFSMLAEDVNY